MYLRDAGSNNCPKDNMITPSECRQYVDSDLGDSITSFATWYQSSYPSGCVQYSSAMYYNYYENGGGNGSMRQLCRKGNFKIFQIFL